MDRWMDGWTNRQTDRWMDRWTDRQTDRWICGWIDGQTDGQMERWMDEWTDGWTDGGNFSPFYRIFSPMGAAALLPRGRSSPIRRGRARELLTI